MADHKHHGDHPGSANEGSKDSTPAATGAEAAARQGGFAAKTPAPAVGEAVHQAAELSGQAAQASSKAARQGGEAVVGAVRRSGEFGSEAARQVGHATGEAERQGAQTLSDQSQMLRDWAEQFSRLGQQVAEAVQHSSENMRIAMKLPDSASGGARDLQQSLSGLIEGVVRTNLRATQELFQLVNPASVVQLQQRFVREYMETLMAGGKMVVRAARRAADETLKPLEEHMEQRRNRQNGSPQTQDGRCVADIMERDVRIASPEDSVQHAARMMREEDTGVLPVGEGDRLVGMVTDRDVAMRLVAEGKDPARTKVREVMTPEVRYVFEDQDLGHLAENMAEQQLRRMPVVSRDKRLVGIVSLGDFARKQQGQLGARAFGGIARQGVSHQSAAE